jgi:hypothetical protein
MAEPNRSVTLRGFTTYGEFTDSYGAKVTIRESPAAPPSHVWIFVEGGQTARPGTERPVNDGSAHLTLAQALRLRDALTAFLDAHLPVMP